MRKRKRITWFIICMILTFSIPVSVNAGGMVTDNITIKVGYWGVDPEDYVEKASYHWTELDDNMGGALESHQVAYSFYRQSSDGKTYTTVIDSARGFYLEDLLNLAGVSIRDIQSVSFYTNDKDIGYFTSFSYSELFNTSRYYYNDLSSYLTPVWKDETHEVMTGVKLSSAAYSDKELVKPMLALEDSWATYEAGTENTRPNFEGLGTGNRFRLLFGQTDPQESRTSQTAKYVHTIYVALNGLPKISADSDGNEIKLSDKVGSHSVTFDVDAFDEAMIEDIIEQLQFSSSDEDVLKIRNIRIVEDSNYEDAVTVTIDYEILKEGNAYITSSYRNLEVEGGTISIDDTGSTDDSGSGDETGSEEGSDDEDSEGSEASESKGDTGLDIPSGEGNEGSASKEDSASESESEKKESESTAEDITRSYILDDEIARYLTEIDESQYEQAEISSEEDEKSIPAVGAGALLLIAAGFGFGIAEFKRKI